MGTVAAARLAGRDRFKDAEAIRPAILTCAPDGRLTRGYRAPDTALTGKLAPARHLRLIPNG